MERMHPMEVWDVINAGLGLDAEELNVWQMGLRALVVYVVGVALVRVGQKRFIGENAAFDVLLAIILGSVISRGITGNAPFFPTLAAGLVLVLLHWLMAALAFRSDWFGFWVKGRSRVLVRDGEIQWGEMRGGQISERDLYESLRKQGVDHVSRVREARLERSGDVSVIMKDKAPRVVEIDVRDGIQTVQIEMG